LRMIRCQDRCGGEQVLTENKRRWRCDAQSKYTGVASPPNTARNWRRWRGLKPGAFFMRVSYRCVSRFTRLPAAQLKLVVGPLSTWNVHA